MVIVVLALAYLSVCGLLAYFGAPILAFIALIVPFIAIKEIRWGDDEKKS